MSEKILVPVLGESIKEATVSKWLKNQGDSIQADEAIVELETDKVNIEVPSHIDGVLSKINAKNGKVVEVGTVLGFIDESVEESSKKEIKKIKVKKLEVNVTKLETEKRKEPRIFNEEPLILTEGINKNDPLVLKDKKDEDSSKKLSPAVRKIIQENNIDPLND